MTQPIKKIEGHDYQIGILDVMIQFHIARRLAPLMAQLGTAALSKIGTARLSEGNFGPDLLVVILGPIAEVISQMSDEDAEYIINNCLAVAMREQKPAGWVPVVARGTNRRMFDDMKLTELLGITIATIEENLGDFFPIGALNSQDAK